MSTSVKRRRQATGTWLALGLLFAAAVSLLGNVATASADPVDPAVTYTIPTISGTVRVGHTLTVAPGAWETGADLTYQWVVGGVDVFGATSTTYELLPTDYKKIVTVRVTGTLDAHTPTTATSKGTAAVAAGIFVKVRPTIDGNRRVGEVLTAVPGAWSPTPTTYTYRWFSNGYPISGATGSTYTLPAGSLGRHIAVRVWGHSPSYYTTYTTSYATTAIARGILTSAVPTVGGTAQVGKTLTVTPGAWAPGGVHLGYTWYLDGVAVSGATGATYTLPAAALGKVVTVRVTGSKTAYTTVRVFTDATEAVILGDITAPAPTITGSTVVGKTLTANSTGWTGSVTKTYQWFRDGAPIDTATSSTYLLTLADFGAEISVEISGSKTAYNPVGPISSDPTPAVVKPFLAAPKPTVTGVAAVGHTITAAPGTWSPAEAALSFQWKRDGVAIAGATSSTYPVSSEDSGAKVSVAVTGTLDGYQTTTVTSSPTAEVPAPIEVIHQDAASAFAELNAWRADQSLPAYVTTVDPLACAFRASAFGSGSDVTPARVIIESHTTTVLLNYAEPHWTAAKWEETTVTDAQGNVDYVGKLKVYECAN